MDDLSWQAIDDRLEGAIEEIGTSAKRYSGLIAGTALETAGKLSDDAVFREYINSWQGDKLFHGWFSKDLSKAAWNGSDRIGSYMEQSDHDYIASAGASLQDPYTKTALAFGAVGVFSGLKEFVYDGNPDGLDIAANYTGFSYHMLTEHSEIEPASWYDDAKAQLRD